MRLIVCAGKSPPDDDELLEAWDVMMNEVGAVYRGSRRGGS
jgi:hypothetical protein